MNDINYECCVGCCFYNYAPLVNNRICVAPENNPSHAEYALNKELFYTKNCPFKRVNNPFIFWN